MAGFGGIAIGTVGTQPGATDFSPFINMRRIQIEAEMERQRQLQLAAQNQAALNFQYDQLAQSQKIAEANALQRQTEFEHQRALDIDNQVLRGQQIENVEKARREEQDWNKMLLERKDAEVAAKKEEEAAATRKMGELEAVKAKSASIVPQAVANLRAQNPALTAEQIRDQLLAQPPEGASPDEWLVLQQSVGEWYKAEKLMEKERAAQEDRDLDREFKKDQLAVLKAQKLMTEERLREENAARNKRAEDAKRSAQWEKVQAGLDKHYAERMRFAKDDMVQARANLDLARRRLAAEMAKVPVNTNAVAQINSDITNYGDQLRRATADINNIMAYYDAEAAKLGVRLDWSEAPAAAPQE